MEHRCSERYAADVKILIYRQDLPVAIGRIKDGNRYGLFIESDLTDVHPLEQMGIELLAYRAPQKLQRFKFEAMVIHTQKRGFGVELDALSEDAENQLLDMLLSSRQSEQASEPLAWAAFG